MTATVRPSTAALQAVEHVGLTVRDLERSIGFYSALLGVSPFYRATEERVYLADVVGYPGCKLALAFFHLPGTETFLELLEYIRPTGRPVDMETYNPGIGHLCFVVPDLDAEFRRISGLGGAFRHPGPVDRADGGRAVYFRDPDGITIELQEPAP
jgi:catechol 2,3-dioxygenase-like lactoylglutathione lyase family enzyme